jgi:hypothetical protein
MVLIDVITVITQLSHLSHVLPNAFIPFPVMATAEGARLAAVFNFQTPASLNYSKTNGDKS